MCKIESLLKRGAGFLGCSCAALQKKDKQKTAERAVRCMANKKQFSIKMAAFQLVKGSHVKVFVLRWFNCWHFCF